MKKIITLLFFNSILFLCYGQDEFNYTIKLDSLTNPVKIRRVKVWLDGMFTAHTVYIPTSQLFVIKSNITISKALFIQKAQDKNYVVLTFERTKDATVEDKE